MIFTTEFGCLTDSTEEHGVFDTKSSFLRETPWLLLRVLRGLSYFGGSIVKKCVIALVVLISGLCLYAQDNPAREGALLTAGKTATLGIEASTAFAWDIGNKSTGLETKVGMELIFPLFAQADRGLYPDNFDSPAVRIALKNAAFTWWNNYEQRGGNYEQDGFNSWTARPLVLSFDSFSADVVWTNYFFRVASSTTAFETDQITLFSIFEEVIEDYERWYVRRSATRALWTADRYNIQRLPLLKDRIARNSLDDDYRGAVSGNLAIGLEFDWISAALKTASAKNGMENNENAWLLGADIEIVPLTNLRFSLTGFAGFNFESNTGVGTAGKNPVSLGALLEYQLPLSDRYILTPRTGFDFNMDTITSKSEWEFGAGVLFYTRGYDNLVSSRLLDWDEVIPIGASVSMNMNQDMHLNLMASWFEPAGPDSMLPNFGGFLQLELSNLLGKGTTSSLAVLTQLEYLIDGKFTPYIRGGYAPEFQTGSTALITGNYLIKAGLGCYVTLIHFFSFDVRYEMNTKLLDGGGAEVGGHLLSAVFTIRL